MGWLIFEIMILITASVGIGVGLGGLAANGFSAAKLVTTLLAVPSPATVAAIPPPPAVPIPLTPTNLPLPLRAIGVSHGLPHLLRVIGVSHGPLSVPAPEAPSPIVEAASTTQVDDGAAEVPQTDASEATRDAEDVPVYVQMPPLLEEPRNQAPDDLKRIKGIGPQIEVKLNNIGVYHFDQIAAWSPDESAWINEKLTLMGRIERDNWINSARTILKLNNAPSLTEEVGDI